jgi:thiol:disulfide interchange protein DsbC
MKKLVLCTAMLLALNVNAQDLDGEKLTADVSLPEHKSTPEWTNTQLEAESGEIVGMQTISVGNLIFVEGEQGTYWISEDGRFAFRGIMQDRWAGHQITDLEAAAISKRIPLKHYPVDFNTDVATIKIGNAMKRQGAVFVDPTTNHSREIIKEILEEPDKFNLDVVLMPAVGGDTAQARAMAIYCATDREQAIKDLAYGTNKSFSSLDPECKRERVPMSLMLNKAFRITGIPHLIREDGRTIKGKPHNLKKWLGISDDK